MAWTRRTLLGRLAWLSWMLSVTAGLDTAVTQCIKDGSPVMKCPPKHSVVVRSAKLHRLSQAGKCTSGSIKASHCLVQDLSRLLFEQCYGHETCHPWIGIPQNGACSTSQGDYFTNITYRCSPHITRKAGRGRAIHMCSNLTWTGSLTYIWSPGFPHWAYQSRCSCTALVNHHVEVEVSVPVFQQRRYTNSSCEQMLQFQSGGASSLVCAKEKFMFKPLNLQIDTQLQINFDNVNNTGARFWVVVQVSHHDNLTIVCGDHENKAIEKRPLPSSAITMSPTSWNPDSSDALGSLITSTPAQPSDHPVQVLEDGNGFLPVLVGAICAATLVLIIAVIIMIVLIKRRQKKKENQEQVNQDLKDFSYDNALYMVPGDLHRLGSRERLWFQASSDTSRDTSQGVHLARASNSAQLPARLQFTVDVHQTSLEPSLQSLPENHSISCACSLSHLEKHTCADSESLYSSATCYEDTPDVDVKDKSELVEHEVCSK